MINVVRLIDYLKNYLADSQFTYEAALLSKEEIEIIVKALEHLQEVENG